MRVLTFFMLLVVTLPAAGNDLQDLFRNPPHDALPRGYWIWPHGNFDYTTIKEELKEFEEKGLGGVDIFDIGIRDRKNVIPPGPVFMSPEQIDGMAFALDEAEKRGLKIGLIVSSSWNAGATWTTPAHAAMNLVASIDTVRGPMTWDRALPFPVLPDSFSKPYGRFPLHVPRDKDGMPEYRKEVATLVFPLAADGVVTNPDQVRRFAGPHVNIDLSEGQWVILRAVCANFGQRLWVPSKNSNGLAIDHFSSEAVTHHFETIISRLEKRCGPLSKTALERLYLASYESNAGVIWTPALPGEFHRRNGYRIEPYLPALFGITIQNEETTERFLYDFRKTVSELFIDNLYRNARDICHGHGIQLCCEAGGPGPPLHDVPTEDLKALGALDVMRGEFWVDKKERLNPDGLEQLQIVKSIASAAHIYGHKIVEMEAFTSHVNWQEGPSTFKPLADRAFCEGMNRVVYHTMVHNLPEAGKPGWTYSAGTHMSTNLTWWDLSAPLHSYMARCSAMLQHGEFVADVCFYYGHEIPNFAKTKHVRPALGTGYDYDDINTEVLLTAEVREGRIVLPSGMSYAVLVLPGDERMDLEVLQKIRRLLNEGATVVGPKPHRVYGLADYVEKEIELRKIADELWGTDTPAILDRKIGRGRLAAGKSVREVLEDMGIGPDVEFLNAPPKASLDFIHRRTENDEFYFIRNGDSAAVTVDARFRVRNMQPHLWDAVTGKRRTCALFVREERGMRIPLHLQGHGSIFVLFSGNPVRPYITRVSREGRGLFPALKSVSSTAIKASYCDKGIDFSAGEPGRYRLELSDGRDVERLVKAAGELSIDGSWEVRFTRGRGAIPVQTFDSLRSWTDSGEPGTRFYSGTATYRKTFKTSEAFSAQADNIRLMLDLGVVRETARVYLNGRELGISSFVPHTFDVTDILRSGENHLAVEVANTWLNRLIADDRLPEDSRLTHTNLTHGPAGTTLWREAAPMLSGLLGPVRILTMEPINITLD